ncbi:unnamed protein product [Coffea canephora]|uniref:malate dehydrogenase n=1 Tax=Coffea canephora TaxID=49390 RepID=A0A068UCX7_COFCA|nr:unnamed protein product [Coffea canephora]
MPALSHSSVMFLSSSDKYLFILPLYSGFQYDSLVKLFLVVQFEMRFGDTKLPLLVYLHGEGFLIKSAFSLIDHAHLNVVVAETDWYTYALILDINHMDTKAVLHGFVKKEQLEDALTGMDLVIIPVGVHRKLGMTRDDLFNINPNIVRAL